MVFFYGKISMKATRHNGRSGKHGTYDAKHNDRRFDVENSEHIDAERTKMNVYWDCYQGYSLQNDKDEQARFTFTEIEKAYYVEKYSDHVDGQNERNRKARHYDRVKTIDAILENNKTCPEETLLQLGNMDWALHLDEATPHIHERHVFDAVNQYGELCPQQDKALEELGFELPKPNEKKGKYNNRKIVFDEECRKLFISICQNHGLTIDVEPVYGGASYLEKQDFIIMNQKKRIEEKQAVLDGLVMKIEDVNAVIEEAVDLAYEKACEVVTKRVKEETVKHDVDVVKDYGELLQQQPKDKLSDKSKSVASKVVNAIVAKLEKASQPLLGNIISALNEPKNKVKAKGQIKEQARVSIQAKLKEKQKQVMEYEKKQDVHIRKKNMEL